MKTQTLLLLLFLFSKATAEAVTKGQLISSALTNASIFVAFATIIFIVTFIKSLTQRSSKLSFTKIETNCRFILKTNEVKVFDRKVFVDVNGVNNQSAAKTVEPSGTTTSGFERF